MEKEIYERGKEIFNYLKDNFKVYTVEECKELKNKGAYGFIYITQCKVNGKLYIGQKKLSKRDFATYLGSGTVFKQAVKKYGKKNFERIILEVVYSKKELDDFEIKYIRLFDASEKYNRDLFYNIACGGGGACLKGEDNPNYGKSPSEETRNKQRKKMKGREVSQETRKKISEGNYKPRVKVKCSYCGKEIEKLESQIRNKSNIFCSKKCQGKWQGKWLGEQMKERLTKYSVVIYPNGEISETMTTEKIADYLNINETTIRTLAREKTCYIGTHEDIRYIRVLHLEDYKKEREIYKSDEDFKNMCKHMVEEAKILYKKKREEVSKTCRSKDGSRYKGFVAIYPNGEISKDMTGNEMMNFLGVGEDIIKDLVIRKNCYTGAYEHIKYIRVLHFEDYLEEREIYKSDEDFRNMCKQMVEKARKKKSEAKKERRVSLICIFPSGKIIKDICISELTKELGVNKKFVKRVLDSHKRYKAPNRKGLERLKQFDGMIIMYQKDYLNIIENKYYKLNKAS